MRLLQTIFKKKIIKFGFVGGLGTITNMAIFFIFVDLLKFSPTIISTIVFFIAATQNYILNHVWTFKTETSGNKISFYGWIKFILTSLLGLAVNLLVLNLILRFFILPYKVIAQAFGILSGMIFNFLGSKYFVFKKKANQALN